MRGRTLTLYRRCDGHPDYVGDMNQFLDVSQLSNSTEADRFIQTLKRLSGRDDMQKPRSSDTAQGRTA